MAGSETEMVVCALTGVCVCKRVVRVWMTGKESLPADG